MCCLISCSRCHEPRAQLGAALDQLLLDQHLQRLAGDGHAQRVAAEGGAVLAGLEDAHHLLRGQERGHRVEAARERLADDHDVGLHVVPLVAEELAGATEARLDLVAEQHVVLLARSRRLAQEAGRRHDDARLALDRLDQEGAGVGRDGVAQGLGVAVGDDLEAGREGPEAVAVLRLGREADDGDGAAVEVVGADDDLGLPVGMPLHLVAPLARGLDRGLDGLGAGVHRQHRVVAGQLAELLVRERQLVVAEGAAGERDRAPGACAFRIPGGSGPG